jgi:cytochrome c biogenesis protein CcmG/thiol:disulfide interchange protein DsbE
VTDKAEKSPPRPRRRPWAMIPVIVFGSLALAMYVALRSGDPSIVPSALVGKPVPDFALPPLEGLVRDGAPVPGLADEDLARGEVSVVNVWASWCAPCREEHPLLMRLSEAGENVVGINYKDETENGRRFLGRLGNPFSAVGVDEAGRSAIDWGVYGVPETFIVDGAGTIRCKHVGPFDEEALEKRLIPAIEVARSGTGSEPAC